MKSFSIVVGAILMVALATTAYSQQIPDADSFAFKGPVAERRVSTPLGQMIVRWPRIVEDCFGRSPSRAVADAAQTVSRALSQAKFDSRLKTGRRDWSLLFLDKATAIKSLPNGSVLSKHPGLMVPPNRIFIIAESIAGTCSTKDRLPVSDELLARVLVHEMAHVLEFVLLMPRLPNERFRAEGFASWFESYASDKSQIIDAKTVRQEFLAMARESERKGKFNPQSFDGSIQHYSRSSMYFNAIVARRGVSTLMDVYEKMANEGVGFFAAVEKVLSWNREELEREVLKVLQ